MKLQNTTAKTGEGSYKRLKSNGGPQTAVRCSGLRETSLQVRLSRPCVLPARVPGVAADPSVQGARPCSPRAHTPETSLHGFSHQGGRGCPSSGPQTIESVGASRTAGDFSAVPPAPLGLPPPPCPHVFLSPSYRLSVWQPHLPLPCRGQRESALDPRPRLSTRLCLKFSGGLGPGPTPGCGVRLRMPHFSQATRVTRMLPGLCASQSPRA